MKVRILTRAEVAALYDPGARWRRVEDLAVIAQDPECAGAFALSSGGGVWVREEARAMWSAEHGAVIQ